MPWGHLRVYISGEGPPVLALHGLGGSGRYWNGLDSALTGDVTIVAPDLAGFGASSKPDVDYSRSFHLENLDRLFTSLNMPFPSVVVGHSMGGVLGSLWAVRHLGDVHALALVASPYPSERARGGELDTRPLRAMLYRAVQTAWPVLTLAYRSSLYPRAVVRDYPRHTQASYWRTAYDLIWNPGVLPEIQPLASTSQRQALMYARDDTVVPLTAMDNWCQLLPGAATQIFDTGGHQLLLVSRFEPIARWIQAAMADRSGP